MENSIFIEKAEDSTMSALVVDKDDWKWPCFDEWYDNYYGKMERRIKVESISIIPFVVIYPRNDKPYVEVSSPQLIEILRDILPNKKPFDEIDDDDKPKVAIKAQDLFLVLEKLKDAIIFNQFNQILDIMTDLESTVHLKRLVRFLEQEFKQTIKAREVMIAHKKVSRCALSGQQVGGIISSVDEVVTCAGKFFKINIKVIKYDGVGFKRCQIERIIEYFNGDVSFSDLPVVPIKLSTAEEFLKENIIANGKQFFKLTQGNNYMNYEGPLLRVRNMYIEKIRADGRVMIDIQSFSAMNPDYPMDDDKPPNKCDIKMFKEKDTYLKTDDLDKDEISKFSDIIFDSDALDHIVMPQNKKNMLEGLVSQYRDPAHTISCNGLVNGVNGINMPEKSLDPITNKGNGCIFLCYGPPGTGKTLTAQSVAEYLKQPLWILTVRELGSTPESLERELVKVLDIAYTWKAVILLDEADIYLEKRSTIDLIRNTMVGIFLRLLEYYQVNMFLHYTKLDLNGRRQIWSKFIKRADLPLKADDFANYDLNGREIRNVLHAARLLAKNKGKTLSAENVIDVISIVQEFKQETSKMSQNDF
ncbi:5040_t:CDS:2 [Racocetra fulgida]|uniref:5040_t:CDS:1 n=1 Tax=Racocetra fulgida TaxID=60492 RepID=A0A9N8WKI7_9GLOM|nr:5040_t:CDS:2 [Racocetra fulgida]